MRRIIEGVVGLALAFVWGCGTDPSEGAADQTESGLQVAQAGLDMAQDGIDAHDRGDPAAHDMMAHGMAMMGDGESMMHEGFAMMANDDMGMGGMGSGGMMGSGAMMMGGCGSVAGMMDPMDRAMGHMQDGFSMMGDADPSNDPAGLEGFRAGCQLAQAALDQAALAMDCMGHTAPTPSMGH